jgi:hypothetical protein
MDDGTKHGFANLKKPMKKLFILEKLYVVCLKIFTAFGIMVLN